MEINMTEIVTAVIGLLCIILTGIIIPLIRSKTTKEQQTELANWVRIAVSAAEQVITGTKLGKQKKEFVIAFLRDQGIDVDDEKLKKQINILIESFVSELNGKACFSYIGR